MGVCKRAFLASFGSFMMCLTTVESVPYAPPDYRIPDEITRDMLDENGRYWVKASQKGYAEMELIRTGMGPNDKPFWEEKDHYDPSNPPLSTKGTGIPDKENKKESDPSDEKSRKPTRTTPAEEVAEQPDPSNDASGTQSDCKVLETGILECDGTTTADATQAANKYLASSMDAKTCPKDGDVCPAVQTPTESNGTEDLECSRGWLRSEDFCYDAAYRMRATHKAAQEYCRQVGGKLIHPITLAEAKQMLQFFKDIWIGAVYDDSADGGWEWLDGTPLPANVSLLGGPKPEPKRRCIRIHSNSGGAEVSFVKEKCNSPNSFICRASLSELLQHQQLVATEAAEAVAKPDQCPKRWRLISSWCHHTPRLVGDWANSELWCNQHHNSKLVGLLDRSYELAVDALVGGNHSYHIGMRFRRATSSWGWMNGLQSQYRNWKHGSDPSYAGGDKDVSCTFRHAKKDYWAAAECTAEKMFVCAFKLPEQNESGAENESEKTESLSGDKPDEEQREVRENVKKVPEVNAAQAPDLKIPERTEPKDNAHSDFTTPSNDKAEAFELPDITLRSKTGGSWDTAAKFTDEKASAESEIYEESGSSGTLKREEVPKPTITSKTTAETDSTAEPKPAEQQRPDDEL